jgi:N-acyl-D-amino-acid deacylase
VILANMTYDIVLKNARIVDGTGSRWFHGAVAIVDETIAAISQQREPDWDASVTVDVDERVVAPGFIDTHSHSDLRLFSEPTLAPKLRQGITTEILGQDGFSMAPLYRDEAADEWRRQLGPLAGDTDVDWDWTSLEEYFDRVSANGIAPNVASLVGHGTVRFEVMGMTDRDPTSSELDEMRALVREALEQGAVGFSTGLVYTPCIYGSTEEVQALAGELAPFGRPFVAHIRSERRGIWEALDEFIDIGADEGIHLSHFKLGDPPQHGLSEQILAVVETARDRGVDITADQYPYDASSTMLSYVLPPWVHADGPEQTLAHLRDEASRERIFVDVEDDRLPEWDNPGASSGWENVVLTHVGGDADSSLEGQSIAAIATDWGVSPIEAACEILVDAGLEVSIRNHFLDEDDVRDILESDLVAVATDGIFGGKPHPRVYGTYPRVLGHYSRDENVLSLEEAVRKMTALPARAMGLHQKGVLRPGMDADVVVFDAETVAAEATYERPNQFPTGIDDVLVNGTFAVRNGEATGDCPGAVIRARSE